MANYKHRNWKVKQLLVWQWQKRSHLPTCFLLCICLDMFYLYNYIPVSVSRVQKTFRAGSDSQIFTYRRCLFKIWVEGMIIGRSFEPGPATTLCRPSLKNPPLPFSELSAEGTEPPILFPFTPSYLFLHILTPSPCWSLIFLSLHHTLSFCLSLAHPYLLLNVYIDNFYSSATPFPSLSKKRLSFQLEGVNFVLKWHSYCQKLPLALLGNCLSRGKGLNESNKTHLWKQLTWHL